jgi:hypothetical protein
MVWPPETGLEQTFPLASQQRLLLSAKADQAPTSYECHFQTFRNLSDVGANFERSLSNAATGVVLAVSSDQVVSARA